MAVSGDFFTVTTLLAVVAVKLTLIIHCRVFEDLVLAQKPFKINQNYDDVDISNPNWQFDRTKARKFVEVRKVVLFLFFLLNARKLLKLLFKLAEKLIKTAKIVKKNNLTFALKFDTVCLTEATPEKVCWG